MQNFTCPLAASFCAPPCFASWKGHAVDVSKPWRVSIPDLLAGAHSGAEDRGWDDQRTGSSHVGGLTVPWQDWPVSRPLGFFIYMFPSKESTSNEAVGLPELCFDHFLSDGFGGNPRTFGFSHLGLPRLRRNGRLNRTPLLPLLPLPHFLCLRKKLCCLNC